MKHYDGMTVLDEWYPPDPLRAPDTDDEEPWPLYPEPRRSWLSRLIAAIRRRIS